MVWLDAMNNNGDTLYFVADRVERSSVEGDAVFAVSGILGDGRYEGEVLVEIGDEAAVTFVDAWLSNPDFRRFVANINRDLVVMELTDAARRLTGGMHKAGRPVRSLQRSEHGGKVAESCFHWRAVA